MKYVMQRFPLKTVSASVIGAALMLLAYNQLGAISGSEGQGKPQLVNSFYKDFNQSMSGDYLAGRFASKNGDMTEAAERYKHSLHYNAGNITLLQRTFALQLLAGKVSDAIDLIKPYENNTAISSLAHVVLAIEDIRAKRYTKAERTLLTVMQGEKLSDMDVLLCTLMIVWSKVGEGQYEEAHKLMANFTETDGLTPIWQYHKALISDLIGRTEEASAAYAKAIASSSGSSRNIVAAAGNFYERTGQLEKAKALYTQYANTVGTQHSFSNELARLEKGNVANERIVANVPMGINEVLMDTVRVLYDNELYQEALVYLRLVLYLDPLSLQAQILMGINLEHDRRFEEAITYYNKVPTNSYLYPQAQLRIASNLFSAGKEQEAMDKLQQMAQKEEVRRDALLMLADIQKRKEQFQEAAETYNQILASSATFEPQDWAVLYNRAVSYERSGQWDKAEADLIKSLELNPGQPDVLNYLAYSWLDRDKNINIAREMIETAIKARPDDPDIIDSMGWVLLKQGHVEESVTYLERAVELKPGDAVLHDHLGDAYWHIGRKTEANFQWEHALVFGAKPDERAKIEGKIANGLPTFAKNHMEEAYLLVNKQKPAEDTRAGQN